VRVGFCGFAATADEEVEARGGRVRPIFVEASEYERFLEFRTGDFVDYRHVERGVRTVWRQGTIVSMTASELTISRGGLSTDTVVKPRNNCLPANTACGLVNFTPTFFPHRDRELPRQ
jgi:hypothetical protein